MLKRIILIGLAIALPACSEEEPEATLDLSTFGQEVAEVQCAKIFECCDQDELGQVFIGVDVTNEAECRAAVEGYMRVFVVPDVERAAQDKTVTLGSQQSCIDDLRSGSCSEFSPSPNVDVFGGSCGGFISPALENSGFCSEDWECKSGFCNLAQGQGSCTTPPNAGDPCASQRCADGLFCDASNVCVVRAELDELCDRNEACLSGNCVEDDTQRKCGPQARVCE